MATVIIKMWFGRDVEWCTRDVLDDLLSMGRKMSSFIDHCKKFRKAFWIILSLKCSWKTLLTRHLNGFFQNRMVFEKFQLKEFYCLCVVHCMFNVHIAKWPGANRGLLQRFPSKQNRVWEISAQRFLLFVCGAQYVHWGIYVVRYTCSGVYM